MALLTNKDIARAFRLLGNVMDLLGENKFKVRSYQQAYITLRKWNEPITDMDEGAIRAIPGVGKAIGDKIIELRDSGSMKTLDKYLEQIPSGVVEMLAVPGLGPAKVRLLWQELNYMTLQDVLTGCGDNALLRVKGFGPKLQAEIERRVRFFLSKQGQLLLSDAILWADRLIKDWHDSGNAGKLEPVGELRRRMPVVRRLELISDADSAGVKLKEWTFSESSQNVITCIHEDGVEADICLAGRKEYDEALFLHTGPDSFTRHFHGVEETNSEQFTGGEHDIANMVYIPPVLRDHVMAVAMARGEAKPAGSLISREDLLGLVHCHTTWSDGLHSVKDMALHATSLGYRYIVITDHSKAAFYANGLDEHRLLEQGKEIDKLNLELNGKIRILKGIECDIMNDGSMDLSSEVLQSLDLVIASIHTNLNMVQSKAMERLLKAVSNPCVHMLGHPTGRILLAREGYPVDHRTLVDACSEYGVMIEINANPARLDLDWTYVDYALEKGLYLSINPDAHSCEGMEDVQYGVWMGQKGGLTAARCANALEAEEFLALRRQ